MADAKQAMVLAFAAWGAKKYGQGDPNQFMQAFQAQSPQQQQAMLQEFQNDPEAQQYMQMAQQQLAKGVTKAKLGSKLSYLKHIKDACPEGEELVYFKQGGRMCKACMKKQQANPVSEFKQVHMEKCGGKAKKAELGKKLQKGGEPKKNSPMLKDPDYMKAKDLASRDSIAANKYNDQDVLIERPGKYVKGIWVPDRTKAPYNKLKSK